VAVPEMTMVYKVLTTVKDLAFKKRALRVTADRTDPAQPVIEWEYEDVGWFVQFEGSYEALFMGREKPMDLTPGTKVQILIKAIP
jgi:hypothetical protein